MDDLSAVLVVKNVCCPVVSYRAHSVAWQRSELESTASGGSEAVDPAPTQSGGPAPDCERRWIPPRSTSEAVGPAPGVLQLGGGGPRPTVATVRRLTPPLENSLVVERLNDDTSSRHQELD